MRHWMFWGLMLAATGQADTGIPRFELISPPEHSSTTSGTIHVVGRTTAPLIEVSLNGVRFMQKIVKDSVFHEQVDFGYGINEINIRPVFSGMEDSVAMGRTVEVMYAPIMDRQYSSLYPSYEFHDETPKTLCLRCHKGGSSADLEEAGTLSCLVCHQNLREKFRKHTKFENASCLTCHDLDHDLSASGGENVLASNLCFRCHEDKIGRFGQSYVHGPVAGGNCTICHSPHGSQYEKNLNSPSQILCYTCHDDVEDQLNKKVVHPPFERGWCVKCHDPHSTNNKWVLTKSSETLCLKCHEEQGTLKIHKHPYNVRPKDKKKVNLELTQDGKLECLSCHNPHSTNVSHLLKTNQEFTCIGCHTDLL